MANTCCPPYTYVDSTGHFFNRQTGTYTLLSNSDPLTFAGLCVRITNNTYAVAPNPVVSPIACPCCPSGYTYDSASGKCIGDNAPLNVTAPIPCINCVCTTVAPQSCPSCGTQGLPINYVYNSFTRQCTDCTPADGQTPKGKINKFLPTNYVNPFINFIYKNKNII